MPQLTQIGSKPTRCPQTIFSKIIEHFVAIGKKFSANVKTTTKQGFKMFLGKRQMSSIVLRATVMHVM